MSSQIEPISVRTTRLNNLVLNRKAATSRTSKLVADALSREGLLDALCLLYSECNKEQLKKRDKQIFEFVSKCMYWARLSVVYEIFGAFHG